MPLELQIIRATDFVRLGPEGHFDLAVSRKLLAELVTACRKRGIHRAMMDLRALQPGPKPVFTPTDLATLVNTFRELGFAADQKLAVLYRTDPHHRAKLFAFIGTLRGWNVAAFGSFEEAMVWLSEDEQAGPRAGHQPGEEMVQVRVKGPVEAKPRLKTKIRPKRTR